MDAFEQLVAELFFAEGYWVQTSVKVDLTKEEKAAIGRRSSPRWEIDVVAYQAATNELLAIECKSFLDSTGVQWAELQDGHASKRYKLFREPRLREIVLERLRVQMIDARRCHEGATIRLAMAAAKIKRGDDDRLEAHLRANDWLFFGPQWLRQRLRTRASEGYSNQVSSMVAKLLLRPSGETPAPSEQRSLALVLADDQPLMLVAKGNPKKPGSKAHNRFSLYSRPEAKTVGDAISLGLRRDDLRNDLKKGFIRVG